MRNFRIGLALVAIMLPLLLLLSRVFVVDKFTVRGQSMEPTLHDGQKIRVNKLAMGPRIYLSYDFESPELKSVRLPGFRRLKPGDIAVLNCPEGWGQGKMGFKINYVYAKRCIGVPGDSVSIVNGFYVNSSLPGKRICPAENQSMLAMTPDSILSSMGVYLGASPHRRLDWTIRDFGPLRLPRKGDIAVMDSVGAALYGRIIEYETGARPAVDGSEYTFRHGYYFFGGDNVLNSRDSRYFGLVQDDFIVGKVMGHRMKREPETVERALEAAGRNRGELESVLWHYRHDERRLRAARWLIANMPGHYSDVPNAAMEALMDAIRGGRVDKVVKTPLGVPERVYDVDVITSEYLIDNIDRAFEMYDSRPWNRYLSEDEFYECLLPYRHGHEPLSEWRKHYGDRYGWLLESGYDGSDVVEAVAYISRAVTDSLFEYRSNLGLPDLSADFLLDYKYGDCKDVSDFAVYLFRSLGIPVVTDFSNKMLIHTWNAVRDTTGRYQMFWLDKWDNPEVKRGMDDGRTKARVFRYCYSLEDGPGYKDVSRDYFGDNEVKVGVSGLGQVWLGAFSNLESYALCPARRRLGSAQFRHLETDFAYVPLIGGEPAGYPFYLDAEGAVHEFHAREDQTVDVSVSRKFRASDHMRKYMNEGLGGAFSVSSYPDFREACVIGHTHHTSTNYNYLPVPEDVAPFRYLRYTSAPGERLQMAEVRVFGPGGRNDTLKVSLASCAERKDGRFTGESIIDGDELSFFVSTPADASFVLDLGGSFKVSEIEWVPRNDDNFIRHGDVYSLLYHDGKNGWKTAGRQVGRDSVMIFRDVPSNALLRLHDETRGREENVFITGSDGSQIFLN